jgi:SAM-dependent methyltransferase
LRQFEHKTPNTLLDIGTADGLVTRRLIECYGFGHHIGIDIRLGYLRAAKENITNVAQADGRYLPLPGNCVDVIVSTAVFKHVAGLDKLLRECRRVLRPDGKLVAIDPTPLGIRVGVTLKHFSRKSIVQILTLQDLERMLHLHGFRTVSKERFMLTPIPFPGSEGLERGLKRWGLDHTFLQQIICASPVHA